MAGCNPNVRPDGGILGIRESNENRIGVTKIIQAPKVARGVTTELILSAQAELSSNPQSLIVVLDRKVKPGIDGGADRSQDLKALLQWGVGGAEHEALVDFLNGTIISVPATVMKVSAVYRVGDGPEPFGPDYVVSVSLGYGTRPTNGQIPSASHTTTIVGNEFQPVQLQRWTTAVQLVWDPPQTSGEVQVYDFNRSVLYTMSVRNGDVVPVVNQATAMTFFGDLPTDGVINFRELLAF